MLRPTLGPLNTVQCLILPCHRDFSLLLGDFSSFARHFQRTLDLLLRFSRANGQFGLLNDAELVMFVFSFFARSVFESCYAVTVTSVVEPETFVLESIRSFANSRSWYIMLILFAKIKLTISFVVFPFTIIKFLSAVINVEVCFTIAFVARLTAPHWRLRSKCYQHW